MSQRPQISLIICTRDRAEQLQRCLATLEALRWTGRWELVVVDNGSRDCTRSVIEEFARGASFPVKYCFQPIPGLSNARNAGIDASSGEVILFTDDDCYPAADFLEACHSVFLDPAIGFASGRILLHDPQDFPTTINESKKPLHFAAFRFIPAGAMKGANLAFRRTTLERIGPFDPLFGAGSHFPSEDADAVMRASLAGEQGCYAPSMVISHHHGRKAADVAKLFRSYDYGRGAYHAKLMTLAGGFKMGIKASFSLLWRMRHRPTMLIWEVRGMIDYWRLR